MRFGVRAKSIDSIDKVASNIITSHRVIFTPNVDIKNELKSTTINIICYDKDGNVIKSVNSGDKGNIEDPENDNPNGGDNNGGSNGGNTTRHYTLSMTSTNTTQGTVSGGGTYSEGSRVNITATPKSGYQFENWSDGNTSASRTINVTQNLSLTATFKAVNQTGGGSNDNDDDPAFI